MVSKLKDAPYRSRRTEDWVKVTCRKRDSFPIVGYALKAGKFDGLYLGRSEGDQLRYAGKVEQGFSDAQAKSVVDRLRPLLTRARALSEKLDKPNARWVRPDLLAEVEYRALTPEGRVRHPSFKGIREDLSTEPVSKSPPRSSRQSSQLKRTTSCPPETEHGA